MSEITPFQFYVFTLHEQATKLASVMEADDNDTANALFHALALHIAMRLKPEDVEDSARGFADELVAQAIRYRDSLPDNENDDGATGSAEVQGTPPPS